MFCTIVLQTIVEISYSGGNHLSARAWLSPFS